MHILAVDTSHTIGSVALYHRDRCLFFRECDGAHRQAEQIFNLVHCCFEETGMGYQSLDALAVNVGPGSFTGVRVGVAAVRGMRLASGLPLVAVTHTEAVAFQKWGGVSHVTALVDARKGQYYMQAFDFNNKKYSEIALVDYEAVPFNALSFYVGDIDKLQSAKIGKENCAAITSDAAKVAYAAYLKESMKDQLQVADHEGFPVYVRSPDAIKTADREKKQR